MTQPIGEDTETLHYEEFSFGEGMGRFEKEFQSGTRNSAAPEELAKSSIIPFLERNGGSDDPEEREGEEDLRSNVAGNLAMGLARVLVAAIRDLEAESNQERAHFEAMVRDHQVKLDQALAAISEIKHRLESELVPGFALLYESEGERQKTIERQNAAIDGWKSETAERQARQETLAQEHQAKLDQALAVIGEIRQRLDGELAPGLDALREADAERQKTLEDHKAALDALKTQALDQVERLAARLQAQEEELASLRPAFTDMSPRLSAVVERLDRQAEAIRNICDAGAQREGLLDELADVVARLKSSRNPGAEVSRADL